MTEYFNYTRPGNDGVQYLAPHTGDDHGGQHRAPAVSQDLTSVGVAPGDAAADLNEWMNRLLDLVF